MSRPWQELACMGIKKMASGEEGGLRIWELPPLVRAAPMLINTQHLLPIFFQIKAGYTHNYYLVV